MAGDLARLEARMSGRVQGVGFRMFAQRQARDAGCTGFVRNSADGRAVEVVAEGDQAALDDLLKALRRGPRLARVVDVQVEWAAATGAFSDFQIRD